MVMRLSDLLALVCALALLAACGSASASQRPSLVIPDASDPGAIDLARVVIDAAAIVAPDAQVGLWVPLGDGIYRIEPVSLRTGDLKAALDVLAQGRQYPKTTEWVSRVMGDDLSDAWVLAPYGLPLGDLPADLASIAGSEVRLHVVSPDTPQARSLARASGGRLFPWPESGLPALVSAIVGSGVQASVVVEQFATLHVPAGGILWLNGPAGTNAQVIANGRALTADASLDLGGRLTSVFLAANDVGILVDSASVRATVTGPIASGTSPFAWARPVLLVLLGLAGVIAVAGSAMWVVQRVARSSSRARPPRLSLDLGDGSRRTIHVDGRGTALVSGDASVDGIQAVQVDLPEHADEVVAVFRRAGTRLEVDPRVTALINGQAANGPRWLNVGDAVEWAPIRVVVER